MIISGQICSSKLQRVFTLVREILAPIKIKSALPPPPPNPKYPPSPKRGILWTWFFLQNGRIFPGVHKIGAAISGPRIADKNFMDTRIFRADFWEGDATKHFSEKKGFFSEKGGGNSVNQGFGKVLYRKGNSVKRFERFH